MVEYKSVRNAAKIVTGYRGIVNAIFQPKRFDEAAEVIDRSYEVANTFLELKRNPTIDNVGELMLRRLALAQVAPNLELRATN